jgi:hypothetical protein
VTASRAERGNNQFSTPLFMEKNGEEGHGHMYTCCCLSPRTTYRLSPQFPLPFNGSSFIPTSQLQASLTPENIKNIIKAKRFFSRCGLILYPWTFLRLALAASPSINFALRSRQEECGRSHEKLTSVLDRTLFFENFIDCVSYTFYHWVSSSFARSSPPNSRL